MTNMFYGGGKMTCLMLSLHNLESIRIICADFFAAELAEKHGWHWKSFQTVYILLQYKNFILYGHSPMAKIAKVLVVKTISSFAKLSQVR